VARPGHVLLSPDGTAPQGQRVHKTAMLGGFQSMETNVL